MCGCGCVCMCAGVYVWVCMCACAGACVCASVGVRVHVSLLTLVHSSADAPQVIDGISLFRSMDSAIRTAFLRSMRPTFHVRVLREVHFWAYVTSFTVRAGA